MQADALTLVMALVAVLAVVIAVLSSVIVGIWVGSKLNHNTTPPVENKTCAPLTEPSPAAYPGPIVLASEIIPIQSSAECECIANGAFEITGVSVTDDGDVADVLCKNCHKCYEFRRKPAR